MSEDSCCPPGSWPGLAEDNTRDLSGKTQVTASGLVNYVVSGESAADKGVVFIYDVHGFSGGRVKSVCDAVAMAGFHCCMPDVYGKEAGVNDFGGFGSPGGKEFLQKHTWDTLEPKLDESIQILKEKGATKIAAVGFCWGAWVVFKLSTTGKISAGASCHPSIKVGKILFDEEENDIASKVKCPQLLLPAGNDPDNLKDGGELVGIVRGLGVDCETTEYPEMLHGWVIRGDATQPAVARDVKAAVDQVTAFFDDRL
eukprot:g376.t1